VERLNRSGKTINWTLRTAIAQQGKVCEDDHDLVEHRILAILLLSTHILLFSRKMVSLRKKAVSCEGRRSFFRGRGVYATPMAPECAEKNNFEKKQSLRRIKPVSVRRRCSASPSPT